MFKKRLLIILTLLLSIFLLVSVVSAEEIANDNNDVEIDGLIDSQMPTEDDSLEVIDLENEDNLEINEETSNEEDISSDVSSSKDKLSGSATSDSGNQVSIPDVTAYDDEEVFLTINSNYASDDYVTYNLKIVDSENVIILDSDDIIPGGSIENGVYLGYFEPGNYKLTFTDEYGLTCLSNLKILRSDTSTTITVPNYSSYYKSGKTINIKTVYSSDYAPLSMKLKLVFKKTGASAKTYYVTTNSKGIAKFKVNLGAGTYKLTVTSANSSFPSNKESATVKISKMPLKITVPNYSSYYKSGKKLAIKVINNKTKKGISVKLKFVYKKAKAKAKTYYVTTNSKGVAKIKIPVGIGKYKLTVTPSSSSFKSNKVSKKVNVNRYVIFKAGKYRGKLTYKQVIALKKAKAKGEDLWIEVKTGKYYIYKKPIYKTVKVKKTKWVYKHVLSSEDFWSDDYNDYTTYDYSLDKYWKNGWTWYGSYYKTYNNGHHTKYYSKFKKKVKYWDTKYVKTGKYKKGKDKIYMTVSTNCGKGLYPKGDLIEVWSSVYWEIHEDNIVTKKIKI